MTNDERQADAEARIRDAVTDLRREGVKPTARAIAERAGCSLRTVTRVMQAEEGGTPSLHAIEALIDAGHYAEAGRTLLGAPDSVWEEVWTAAWRPDAMDAADLADWANESGADSGHRQLAAQAILSLAVRRVRDRTSAGA